MPRCYLILFTIFLAACSIIETPVSNLSPLNNSLPLTHEYRIRAHDELDVRIWDQEKLSSRVRVRSDLSISLPLIGDIQIGGLTPTEASVSIQQRLDGFVRDPRVAVIVTHMQPQTCYVLGEVARPGAYPLHGQQSILHALAYAGGLATFSAKKNIFVLRQDDVQWQRIYFNYQELLKNKGTGNQFILQEGDILVVE